MFRRSNIARLLSIRAVVAGCAVFLGGLLAAAETAQASSIRETTIQSAALGRPLAVAIYRPDDPRRRRAGRFSICCTGSMAAIGIGRRSAAFKARSTN